MINVRMNADPPCCLKYSFRDGSTFAETVAMYFSNLTAFNVSGKPNRASFEAFGLGDLLKFSFILYLPPYFLDALECSGLEILNQCGVEVVSHKDVCCHTAMNEVYFRLLQIFC